MAEPGALTGALNWYRGIPFSVREPLGRITVPTSFIWGRHDVALSRRAVELTADYVVGPYEVVELEAGHWLPETKPDAVADAILARVGQQTASCEMCSEPFDKRRPGLSKGSTHACNGHPWRPRDLPRHPGRPAEVE